MLISRVLRTSKLRQERIEIDERARRFIDEVAGKGEIHIVAHRPGWGYNPEQYAQELEEQREYNHIPQDETILFLEIEVEVPSEFEDVLEVRGVEVSGCHTVTLVG